jgi:leucyl-tRNA synthetase
VTKDVEGLMNGIADLDWPNEIKARQSNWIGLEDGYSATMQLSGEGCKLNVRSIELFVKNIDRIEAIESLTISTSHPLIQQQADIKSVFAINPMNGTRIEIKTSSFLQPLDVDVSFAATLITDMPSVKTLLELQQAGIIKVTRRVRLLIP